LPDELGALLHKHRAEQDRECEMAAQLSTPTSSDTIFH
jgi:hypothetical protein